MNAITDLSSIDRAALAEEAPSPEQKAADIQRLRALILEGMDSPMGCAADDAYFERLRDSLHRPTT